MALSWMYLLQMILFILFLTFVVTIALTWLAFYWNEQIIRAEIEIYRTNVPNPQGEIQQIGYSDADFDKLMEKDEDMNYKWKIGPNGDLVPNEDV